MSASNTYMIQRDCIPTMKGRYWYKLSYTPIMDSLNVRFDLQRGQTEFKFKPFEYNYKTVENDCIVSEPNFKVFSIVSADTLPYEDNGINYIPTTSNEAKIFARCLIGTTININNEIVSVTKHNFLDYIDQIIGCTFIDFYYSNQIKGILNNESSNCSQIDVSYFYLVAGEDD